MSLLSPRHGWRVNVHDVIVCSCAPVNPKHTLGWHCLRSEHLAAWRQHEPQAAGVRDGQQARRLAWLWLQWDQHPEAKRLSGR